MESAGKQQAIQKALQAAPGKSDRQLAKAIGVHHETVGVQRKELESTGGIRQLDRTVGADGKEYPRQVERKAPGKSDRQLAKAIGVSHPTVATARKDMEEKGDVLKFNTSIDSMGRQQPRQVERKAREPELQQTSCRHLKGLVREIISRLFLPLFFTCYLPRQPLNPSSTKPLPRPNPAKMSASRP